MFPSNGVPTITVTFTRDDEDPSNYTYKTESAFAANNKYNIVGTYTEPLGVILSGGITLQPWVTDPTAVNFDFDESNTGNNSNSDPNTGGDNSSSGTDNPNSNGSETTDPPVVGQTYKGCYVVSVNSEAKTAVLLSPTEKRSYNGGNGGENSWLNTLNTALSSWEVDGISGTWRIPALTEIEDISAFPEALGIKAGNNQKYFCLVDSHLEVVPLYRKAENAGGYIEVRSNDITEVYDVGVFLRPVIDISY